MKMRIRSKLDMEGRGVKPPQVLIAGRGVVKRSGICRLEVSVGSKTSWNWDTKRRGKIREWVA